MEKWNGKVALVTGANSGIGAGITKKLLQHGMQVVGVDKNTEYLEALKDKYFIKTLHVVNIDLTNEEELLRSFDWIEENLGGLDVLVNNAGIVGRYTLLEGGVTEWRNMLNVNLVALCMCSKEAVKSMQKHNVSCGHIINLSSNAAHIVPEFAPLHFYCATKHAVKAVTEGLRQELRTLKSPIRITSISPGIVKTSIVKSALGEEMDAVVYKKNPSLQVEDIAEAVEYILKTPPHVQIQDITIKPLGSLG